MLWDVTPVPFESRTCELAAFGRPKKGGEPAAGELRTLGHGGRGTGGGGSVPGNTGDPGTVGPALDRLRRALAWEG